MTIYRGYEIVVQKTGRAMVYKDGKIQMWCISELSAKRWIDKQLRKERT